MAFPSILKLQMESENHTQCIEKKDLMGSPTINKYTIRINFVFRRKWVGFEEAETCATPFQLGLISGGAARPNQVSIMTNGAGLKVACRDELFLRWNNNQNEQILIQKLQTFFIRDIGWAYLSDCQTAEMSESD